jgi:hypothetical protein
VTLTWPPSWIGRHRRETHRLRSDGARHRAEVAERGRIIDELTRDLRDARAEADRLRGELRAQRAVTAHLPRPELHIEGGIPIPLDHDYDPAMLTELTERLAAVHGLAVDVIHPGPEVTS